MSSGGLLCLCLLGGAAGLQPTLRPGLVFSQARCVEREPTAGKGFGAKKVVAPAAPRPPRGEAVQVALEASAVADASGLSGAEERGRLALEKMRKESGQKPLRIKRGPALTPEELAPVDPSAGVMPQVVSDRMLRRVVPFAALPIVGAVAIFGGFYYANTQLELDLPPQIVAYATQACVLLSFAGITWGVMSTSWDEEIEGSLLGLEQVGRNFNLMRGGEDQRREEAKLEFAEADAAKDGVIMSRSQLAKQQSKKSK